MDTNKDKNSAGRLDRSDRFADPVEVMQAHGFVIGELNGRRGWISGRRITGLVFDTTSSGAWQSINSETGGMVAFGDTAKELDEYLRTLETPASAGKTSDIPANQQPGKTPARAWQSQIHVRFTPTWYISDLPGKGGADWGWTDDPRKALALSEYWQMRFAAYARGNRRAWGFVPVASAVETSDSSTQEPK